MVIYFHLYNCRVLIPPNSCKNYVDSKQLGLHCSDAAEANHKLVIENDLIC